MFCISGCALEEVSLLYSDSTEKDGFYIAINKTANCCFVGKYNCAEYTENLEITIPDDCNGVPIKRIGGYYGRGVPTPFFISVADLYINAPEDSDYNSVFSGDINEYDISEEYTIKDIVFHLNIGKNVEIIEFVVMDKYYPHINEDGSIVFYHPVVNIECSSENNYFYSKQGKLYNKNTDKLVSDFVYEKS
jgi:hypothetical protein